ncbi:response regulator [Paraburkholderia phymatum]|uniref:Response regulator receiver protein n=1 Tax=Paraburkholderia phymatum (strain DSM 17167 / CIP 108236 / LMG 21445 / STM815) TaxID=391038 RepID=B2JPB2_PARP8|nr:response regulator [Paraburkholderia phymatum]ACC73115.1 response regulator receiver protein [Paraburkholderia phymatum STM815]
MRSRTFTPTRSQVWTRARFIAQSFPPRVLIVDDYIDSADALAAFLAATGFETRVAYNGCDALQIANEWHPDSIVLDIAMPGVSGLAVARALRESPSTASVPLLAYTAYETGDNYALLRNGGFDAVCPKPVDPLTVVDILATLLGTGALHRAQSFHSS